MFYYDWTMILVIPGLLLGMWAQFKVKSSFDKYQRVLSAAATPPKGWRVCCLTALIATA